MTGIDATISPILTTFQNKLWTGFNRELNGRCYRNLRDKKLIAEVNLSGTKEYKEVMFNDMIDVLCFFDVIDRVENISEQPYQRVRIIFAVNLSVIYPGLDYKSSEDAQGEVVRLLRINHPTDVKMESIDLGLKAYGDLNTERLKQYNMYPWWTFGINCKMLLNYNC